jgi:hypothetical protein
MRSGGSGNIERSRSRGRISVDARFTDESHLMATFRRETDSIADIGTLT